MNYIKETTYVVACNEPLSVLTKAAEDGLQIATLNPGSKVFCKSYTVDDKNDTWIRTNNGWVRATYNNHVLIR